MHLVEATMGGDTLGWSFDDSEPIAGVNPCTAWRVRLAIEELLSELYVSKIMIESIVGRSAFGALLQREFLSCLCATYAFLQQDWVSTTGAPRFRAMWSTVRRELRWATSFLFLA